MLGPCRLVSQAVEAVEEQVEEQESSDVVVDKTGTTAEKSETRGSDDALLLALLFEGVEHGTRFAVCDLFQSEGRIADTIQCTCQVVSRHGLLCTVKYCSEGFGGWGVLASRVLVRFMTQTRGLRTVVT